jgi:hypothetical protein
MFPANAHAVRAGYPVTPLPIRPVQQVVFIAAAVLAVL